jgi:hypothetical protein
MPPTSLNDFITVYESSDAGTGDPTKTTWQFFVGAKPVTTTNSFLAETVRLAIMTNSKVMVTVNGNTLTQVRIALKAPAKSRATKKAR